VGYWDISHSTRVRRNLHSPLPAATRKKLPIPLQQSRRNTSILFSRLGVSYREAGVYSTWQQSTVYRVNRSTAASDISWIRRVSLYPLSQSLIVTSSVLLFTHDILCRTHQMMLLNSKGPLPICHSPTNSKWSPLEDLNRLGEESLRTFDAIYSKSNWLIYCIGSHSLSLTLTLSFLYCYV